MTDQFVGEIRPMACEFAPSGWAICDGQIMAIQQNSALFSLLGVMYGGNGTTTFGLPNLQNSVAVHASQSDGYVQGDAGGSDTVTLLSSELPVHTHTMQAGRQLGSDSTPNPGQSSFTRATGGSLYEQAPIQAATPMAAQMIAPVGSNLPHNNLMPYNTLLYCIALAGRFPQRP